MIVLPSAPLRQLIARLTVARLRRGLRRARTPRGLVFLVLGLVAVGLWIAAVLQGGEALEPHRHALVLRGGMLAFLAIAVLSSASNRGLHLPAGRVDWYLSLAVGRADLLRYCLWSAALRAWIGAWILAAFAAARSPHPLGTCLAVPAYFASLAVVGAGVGMWLGHLEERGRLARTGRRLALGAVAVAVGLTLWARARGLSAEDLGVLLIDGGGERLLRLATAPLEPFVALAHAAGPLPIVLGLAGVSAIFALLVELVAHLPGDPREQALGSAAITAGRLRRAGRVGAAAAAGAPRATRRSLPRLLGRGPVGTLAWRKGLSIWRRSRGFFMTSGLLGCFVLVLLRTAIGARGGASPSAPFVLALCAVLYLTNGLRFDFREDVDQLDVLRSWPLAPWKVFLGTLLPEVIAVSGLVAVLVGLWFSFYGGAPLVSLGLVLVLPVVTLGWVAIDNIAFLLWPVRLVPGSSGGFQQTGRNIVLGLGRLLALALFLAVAGAAAWGVGLLLDLVGLPGATAAAQGVVAALVLLGGDALLVWGGGLAFAAYDPAMDRPD